jgi:hypothetical protein
MELSDELLLAAKDLDLTPRDKRWRSLTSCVLDAVWSIGISYDSKVVAYVRNVFALMDGGDPLTSEMDDPGPDPTPLSAFRRRFTTPEELILETSKHLTSTRSGIRKADAALRYADVLLAHGVDTLADARDRLKDTRRSAQVTTQLKQIPGDGVRTGYFWMLVGARDLVKPDRHILEWLNQRGHRTDVAGARRVLDELSSTLTRQLGREISPSGLDHAIWRSQARD